MTSVDSERIKRIGEVLLNNNNPLKARFRALFSLKNVPCPLSIEYISRAFNDSSALLKHELAYCLGQMQDERAVPLLCQVLENENQEAIVRHEAAEALGAIGSHDALGYLLKFSKDNVREVRETCQLALDRLEWIRNHGTSKTVSPFNSIDPAPASDDTDIFKLEEVMMDNVLSLFERYRAMFALRNLETDQSAMALTRGLRTDSALFSHEVAFVLGQMQRPITVPALIQCLNDTSLNEMVRHECAEALGAIATTDCFETLRIYLHDDKRVVRESCEIALDMCDYENSDDFQYALVNV